MLSDTQRRLRPMTAGVTNRKRNNKEPPTSASNWRRVRRVASAKDRVSAQPPDLNPPEWLPLIADLQSDALNNMSPAVIEKSPFENETEKVKERHVDLTFPDLVDQIQASRSRLMFSTPENKHSDINEDDQKSQITQVNSSGPAKVKTRDDLKEFLSAAMDSVRFFLVTSSIGQAQKDDEKEKKDKDSETSDEDTDEDEFIIPRSELLIKNAALTDKPWRFSIETYRYDSEMLEYYTGFRNYDLIMSIFKLIKPSQETILKWENAETEGRFRDGAFRSGIVTLFDEFFMFLIKLRHNFSTEDLSVRFSMNESVAEDIITDWLHYLYICFGQSPVWASRDNTDIFMPTCFKALSPCVRMVVHVARISVRTPRHVQMREWQMRPKISQVKEEPSVNLENMTHREDADSLPGTPRKFANQAKTHPDFKKKGLKVRTSSRRKMNVPNNKSIDKPIANEVGPISVEMQAEAVKVTKHALNPQTAILPDSDGIKRYKSIVIFQPTGAAAFIGQLYPSDYKTEDILKESGVLELLDECDDILTLDKKDELDQSTIEEVIHPYAVNYLNTKFLMGHMSEEELTARSPLKAHRLKCMHWHVYHSIEWIEKMKIWDELAELPEAWVRNIERVWTISCLLSNFLPADPCLSFGTSG